MKNFFIKTSKGRLSAAVHETKSKAKKLAVICPGYLDSKYYDHLVTLAHDLSGLGYTVVRFDPTGTWDSGGKITDYTTTQYLEDVKNVIDFMTKDQDFKSILLGGHSVGGMTSLLYAPTDMRVNTVLGIMPPYSVKRTNTYEKLESWKKAVEKESRRDVPGKDEFRSHTVPYSFVSDRLKYDVLDNIDDFRGQTILIAGEADEIVKPQDVEKIYNAANNPKEYSPQHRP